jgi:hypothetical protein
VQQRAEYQAFYTLDAAQRATLRVAWHGMCARGSLCSSTHEGSCPGLMTIPLWHMQAPESNLFIQLYEVYGGRKFQSFTQFGMAWHVLHVLHRARVRCFAALHAKAVAAWQSVRLYCICCLVFAKCDLFNSCTLDYVCLHLCASPA